MVAVQYSAPTSTLESYTTDTYLTGRLNPIPMDKVPPTIASSSTATSTPGATLPQHEEDGSTGMHIGIGLGVGLTGLILIFFIIRMMILRRRYLQMERCGRRK